MGEKENLLQQNNRLELTIDKLQESIEVLNDLTKEKEELNTKIIILRSELDDKTYQCDERKACIDELMMKQNVREKRDLKLAEINATAIGALSRERKRLRDSNGSLKSELTNANNSLKELEDLLATKEEEKNTVLSEKTLLLSKCAKFDQGSSLMGKKMITYRSEKEGFKNLEKNNAILHVKNKVLAEEKKLSTEKNDELNSKIDRFEKLLKKKDNELIVLEDNQHKTLSKEALTQSRFIKLGKQLRIAEEELVSFKNLNKKSLVKYNVLSEESKLFDANIHVLQSELDHANESLKEVKDAVIMKDEEMKKIGNVCDRNKTLIEEKESLELRLESLEFDREELLVQLGLFRQTQEESHTMYESVITKMQEDNERIILFEEKVDKIPENYTDKNLCERDQKQDIQQELDSSKFSVAELENTINEMRKEPLHDSKTFLEAKDYQTALLDDQKRLITDLQVSLAKKDKLIDMETLHQSANKKVNIKQTVSCLSHKDSNDHMQTNAQIVQQTSECNKESSDNNNIAGKLKPDQLEKELQTMNDKLNSIQTEFDEKIKENIFIKNNLEKRLAEKDDDILVYCTELEALKPQFEENKAELSHLTNQVETQRQESESKNSTLQILGASEEEEESIDFMKKQLVTLAIALEKAEEQKADAMEQILTERKANAENFKRLGNSVRRFYLTLDCGTS